ncbi:MAG: hypothetical protein KC800_29045 [Candidatus Eremiobacteraeota bacterium]|nr:hypothetical protein [Candidatus Eremiobacteraeota bacterium]
MSSRPDRKAFSLVEAVFASFLLLAGILMSVSLFDASLKAEVGNEKRVQAALVAESVMARVRRKAQGNVNGVYNRFNEKTLVLPGYPDFKAFIRIKGQRLAIPSNSTEDGQYSPEDVYPVPTGRFMWGSAIKAQVEVTWDEGGERKLTLVENVYDFTPTTDFKVTLTDSSKAAIADSAIVNVPRREKEVFSVESRSRGIKVKDMQYTWYVEPLTGMGSVYRVSRDGSWCTYLNAYRTLSDVLQDGPGACYLVVEATYQGVRSVDKVRIENEE